MTYIWAEYIWLDSNNNYRSKTKIMENVRVMSLRETLADDNKPHDKVKVVNPSSNNNQCPSIEPSPLRSCFNLELYPDWNYDGSSTGQAEGRDSEVLVKPVKVVADPFRRGYNDYICVLVLCDTWLPNGEPHPNNTRVKCQEATDKANVEALFGLEQEFFLVKNGHPLSAAIQKKQFPKPQGPYYCSVGADNSFGRKIVESALENCVYAGLAITGMNAEVAPSQWELQVCAQDTDAADQLHLLRYILNRTAEDSGVSVDLEPKPFLGDWNGSGCHANYSTKEMRQPGGYVVILEAIKKLEMAHEEHMAVYGSDNHLRLSGLHETADMHTFSYGVANRGASIRIPRETERLGYGYLEDRRPSSNMDPYLVIRKLVETTTN